MRKVFIVLAIGIAVLTGIAGVLFQKARRGKAAAW